MKVDNGAAQQAYASAAYRGAVDSTRRVAPDPAALPDGTASAVQNVDRVQISSQGRLCAQALDAVQSAPQARAKLVMELRSQIQAGTYAIDGHNLVQQLARHIAQP